MPIRTSITSDAPCRCLLSESVSARAPSVCSSGTGWTLPQTRGIASAFTFVLDFGRSELSTAPSRNSTLLHRRSGPTRPPRVGLCNVLPDERDLCSRVENAIHHYVISSGRRREHGRSGYTHSECSE
ncbi:hypothetical protein T4D_7901 [Trichinella pseudospiralis]|uniref:Uncharacterized protein n=1 Tax=Trichinella pseudospiralis TaxID=6337 RepID=A0A0V1FZC7_TRIPS|nr:hypothetical protein T4D_7901 [Trichinella pseudospiralis]